MLKQKREANQTLAKVQAHKTYISQGHPNAKAMRLELDTEVERAARLEIEEDKQKQERIKLQDQQNIIHTLRRDSYQKGVRLRQLTAENKLLDQDHKARFEKELESQHTTIAEREIQITQQQDVLRLRRENEERKRSVLVEEAKYHYMDTDAFKQTQHLAASIALENQELEQRALEQKQLAHQLAANQVLHATRDITNYAKVNNIPVENVMDNISTHIDEIEMSGKAKVEAFRIVYQRVKETDQELKRRDKIVQEITNVPLSADITTRIEEEIERRTVKTYFADGDELRVVNYFRDYPTMPQDQFDTMSGWYHSEIARYKK
jgi:hypothetical protein